MKKRLIALCAAFILLFPAFGLAESSVDFGSMSFDELIALRELITQEITSRAEWKKVFVPAGVYEVGIDIPAGRWTLTYADTMYFGYTYGNILNETKTDISYDSDPYASACGASKESPMYDMWFQESVSIEIQEGNYIVIAGNCYFTPYIRPSLGF